ncbi:MAG: tRNA (adenosine(37)-N6)-dimethylallyltransferase MiaA [Clostridia bacterium]|nr:tRNA (adenosine(37)-N6)-dimethylallyltransferase MiaA [Clostridia bacterium]
MKEKIIAVVGPTASGKTSLSIRLAQELNGEIVSCDSMQIYRGMCIGTAAPTVEEMAGIPHHLIGFVSPAQEFSVAEYRERAAECIADIASRGKTPIFCGGTGLYLDALLRVSAFSEVEKSEDLRRELTEYAAVNGNEVLHAQLAEVDPSAAEAIHPNNVRRVVRALEMYRLTGITKTEWDKRSLAQDTAYDARILALDFHDRTILHRRIEIRVDQMMEQGLEAEIRALYDAGLLQPKSIAGQAIGYKEFLPYLAGESTLDAVAEEIKGATRRYARRQLTWFRRYEDAMWLYPDTEGDPDASLKSADELVQIVLDSGYLK